MILMGPFQLEIFCASIILIHSGTGVHTVPQVGGKSPRIQVGNRGVTSPNTRLACEGDPSVLDKGRWSRWLPWD